MTDLGYNKFDGFKVDNVKVMTIVAGLWITRMSRDPNKALTRECKETVLCTKMNLSNL